MTDREAIDSAKAVYALTYSADNLDDLKSLVETLFTAAQDITLTSSGFEGGHQAGQITGITAMHKLRAAQELLAELDPDFTPPLRSRVICPDWRFSSPV